MTAAEAAEAAVTAVTTTVTVWEKQTDTQQANLFTFIYLFRIVFAVHCCGYAICKFKHSFFSLSLHLLNMNVGGEREKKSEINFGRN